MRSVDLSPIGPDEQTESPFDLFLIFVGANIVATTLQVGASLPATLGLPVALGVIAIGAVGGAALTAVLAPIGTRLRVPSIVAARAPLGLSGARLLALLLFVTNFAWIALNNAIAASICARLTGVGPPEAWAVALGLVATLVVLGGPRSAALVDRVAVPLLLVAGGVFTVALLRSPLPSWPAGASPFGDIVRGLDVVAGYQVSWLLMFADYPRFTRSARAAGIAVFLGLALTALWFMPLGLVASALAGSSDPGAMVYALQLGWWGATLLALAALTTNFVNIYMSALAFKSLRPSIADATAVWTIGGVGSALGLLSTGLLDRFAGFTLFLGSALVPIGGILLAHYFVLQKSVRVADLYDEIGPYAKHGGWSVAGLTAWGLGALAFHLAGGIGGVLPCLAVSIAAYAALAERSEKKEVSSGA
ncbi:MAG: cytosine permease [Acidobacteria bacterium]|nr:cytosine permease [Acidobacteriota bacterium]